VRWVEVAGYIASSLVFLTFYMRRMVPLRLVALCSNVAFLTYAIALHLAPIAILHGALIPVNIIRLIGALREEAADRRSGDPNSRRYLPRRSGIA
jgi:CRP/FNR family cyclic AMP-dependent transcriptional regulator